MTLMRRITATAATAARTLLEDGGAGATSQPVYMPLLLEATATVSASAHASYLNFVADGLIDVDEGVGNGGSRSVPLDDVDAGHVQDNGSTAAAAAETGGAHLTFVIVKCFIIGFIILAAILGNMLVIVSVMRHRKLR